MALEFTLNHDAPATADFDCIVVGAFADKTLTPAAQAIDKACGGRLTVLAERGDVSGKTGKTTVLHDLPGVTAPRVLVIGLGDAGKFGVPQYIKAVGDAARALKTGPGSNALFTLSEVGVKDRDAAWNIRQAVIAADHASYRYTATLGKKKADESSLAQLAILGSDGTALLQGQSIANGVTFARELGNLPPNICNPAYLADEARKFAAAHAAAGAESEILDEAQMEALGMGSLLAASMACAAGVRVLSPYAPTTMQSKLAVAGASWFSLNSSAMEQIPRSSRCRLRTIAGSGLRQPRIWPSKRDQNPQRTNLRL